VGKVTWEVEHVDTYSGFQVMAVWMAALGQGSLWTACELRNGWTVRERGGQWRAQGQGSGWPLAGV